MKRESRGTSFVESDVAWHTLDKEKRGEEDPGVRPGILRNISADQTIQLSVREQNSCLLGGEVVTHLVNSHEMFAVWRSYNFKDLKADLSQQEQEERGSNVGNVGSGVWTEKLANTRLKYSAMMIHLIGSFQSVVFIVSCMLAICTKQWFVGCFLNGGWGFVVI